jgi:hypothetical protein
MSPRHAFRIAGLALVSLFGLAPMIAMTVVPGRAEECRRPVPVPAYSMEVLVDGTPLTAYSARGTTYVEALKGREYAIRLTNRTGERVAVALAVDGLNSIDAKHTSSRDARKWILAPWETITLSGWQTGTNTARRFVFTSESSSYGSWLGRTSDLGVISAAFFLESRREEITAPEPSMPQSRFDRGAGKKEAPAAAPLAPPAGETKSRAKDELAATGIGREVDHRVTLVDFEEEDSPASIVSLRYEYHEALVRLGVIPAGDDALARRERARGFADPGFAPDPYRLRP